MGLSASWPLAGKGGFSNLPVIGWLFVPLLALGEVLAPWVFTAMGLAALAAAAQSWALRRATAAERSAGTARPGGSAG